LVSTPRGFGVPSSAATAIARLLSFSTSASSSSDLWKAVEMPEPKLLWAEYMRCMPAAGGTAASGKRARGRPQQTQSHLPPGATSAEPPMAAGCVGRRVGFGCKAPTSRLA